ncbi:DUF805 domain-containing protein [Vibrio sonorensis]|uniref:DUF805 domain-containing protein n=1 Tax=Vibrio sonorensis TaxID=1004316 RepID=UPI0008DA4369|nr:DUF805 domain-containing protein [Vibrio sonorensis]
MSIKELLFSFEGRIGRKTFWMWNVVYYMFIAGFIVGISTLFPNMAHLLLPIFLLIILVPDLAITAKRWHDRDKSSWWLLLNIPLLVGRMAAPIGDPSLATEAGVIDMLSSIAALACGAYILFECGLMKGTSGPNKYGQPPQ